MLDVQYIYEYINICALFPAGSVVLAHVEPWHSASSWQFSVSMVLITQHSGQKPPQAHTVPDSALLAVIPQTLLESQLLPPVTIYISSDFFGVSLGWNISIWENMLLRLQKRVFHDEYIGFGFFYNSLMRNLPVSFDQRQKGLTQDLTYL